MVSGLCPSSGKSTITTFRKLELLPSSDEGSEDRSRSSFRNVVILDFRTMYKVQNTVSSHCYTRSSEPFIIYVHKVLISFENLVNLLSRLFRERITRRLRGQHCVRGKTLTVSCILRGLPYVLHVTGISRTLI